MTSWFKPKRFGYGAAPANWKGWMAVLTYLAVLAGIQLALQPARNAAGLSVVLAVTAGVTAVFVWIAWTKTEGSWRWRWGFRRKGDWKIDVGD